MALFTRILIGLANTPGLREVYRSTAYYKAKRLRRERDHQARVELRERLFRDALRYDLTVRHGPFAGMLYVNEASCSQVFPKILGSYEEPVHSWIEEIISGKIYDLILDIGCAEGYYAVGFARQMPNVRVKAFDIDAQARDRTKRLAELNQVGDRVSVGSECGFEHFQQFGGPSTLIFCDIEGAEDVLLDPVKAPRLKDCGIFVETHDFQIKGISDRLIERFGESHRIRMAVDYPGRLGNYNLQNSEPLSASDRATLMDEIRPPCMRFFFLESLSSMGQQS